jgi:hypothetical protein
MIPQSQRDEVGSGVAIAISCQAALIVAGVIVLIVANSLESLIAGILFAGWGVVQWLFLIPVYFMLRRKGRRLAAKGILIAGGIGFMLNAACDTFFRVIS